MNDSVRTFYLNSTQLVVTLEDLEEVRIFNILIVAVCSGRKFEIIVL